MTSILQQIAINDEIARVKDLNQKATDTVHSGHDISIVRWSGTHKIKMCNTCECTVAPLIESKSNNV